MDTADQYKYIGTIFDTLKFEQNKTSYLFLRKLNSVSVHKHLRCAASHPSLSRTGSDLQFTVNNCCETFPMTIWGTVGLSDDLASFSELQARRKSPSHPGGQHTYVLKPQFQIRTLGCRPALSSALPIGAEPRLSSRPSTWITGPLRKT